MKFDLVLYSTPPITLQKAVSYVKNRDGAATYLLLKDIFPQNALDLGMLKKTGVKGLFYRYFKNKEIKLYVVSDYIGCMSEANVEFLLKHNPESQAGPLIFEASHQPSSNSIEIISIPLGSLKRFKRSAFSVSVKPPEKNL